MPTFKTNASCCVLLNDSAFKEALWLRWNEMILNIVNYPSDVIERSVYRLTLHDYPNISAFEMFNILHFIAYEEAYGRKTEIVCDDPSVIEIINNSKNEASFYDNKNNNINPFVYHATGINSAKKILSGGKLLSAAKVYGKSGEQLAYEKMDSPWNDPADYFDYIMFGWGNAPVGDYVVMSERPDEPFVPGVRFYFKLSELINHPGCAFDGYHPIKIRDEIDLSLYLYACIIPCEYKPIVEQSVLSALIPKIYFVPHNGAEINEWNNRVYDYIMQLGE
jgi:hypothetical protein